jgi:Flp pilus assembly protein TadD
MWRARQQELNAKVIVGPYPDDRDLQRLRSEGVTTIVSLLDPRLPYERVLLERERAAAREAGLTMADFPMTSLLGRSFGGSNEASAADAADYALRATGKVYLHCYLGIHRVKIVGDLLRNKVAVAAYTVREGERTTDKRLLDTAQLLYETGDYSGALATLRRLERPAVAADLLRGWTCLHLNRLAEASQAFHKAAQVSPRDASAWIGLGYVSLRTNDLITAKRLFEHGLALRPNDGDALTGAGFVAFRRGQNAEARRLFTRALSIDPGNAEARAILNRLPPPEK